MCGRYTVRSPGKKLAEVFVLAEEPHLEPRYNIAPTQEIPVVRINPQTGDRQLAFLRWGLVPAWADDPAIGNRMINARAETAASKPAFRGPFRHRRCLVVCDGFYEWKRAGAKKQPYYITMKDGQPFALAGLWEDWEREGEIIESATILTTLANELVSELHDRMPVILDPKDYQHWLDPQVQDPKRLEPLLATFPADKMTAYPVSKLVNDPRHEDPKCVEREG